MFKLTRNRVYENEDEVGFTFTRTQVKRFFEKGETLTCSCGDHKFYAPEVKVTFNRGGSAEVGCIHLTRKQVKQIKEWAGVEG